MARNATAAPAPATPRTLEICAFRSVKRNAGRNQIDTREATVKNLARLIAAGGSQAPWRRAFAGPAGERGRRRSLDPETSAAIMVAAHAAGGEREPATPLPSRTRDRDAGRCLDSLRRRS